MWPVTSKFADTVTGSHRAVVRARLCSTIQFGPDPAGEVLPLLAGDVKLSATADVKGTCELTVPGDYWDAVQPYGPEVFIERGVDFGDGTAEYVPLGYFRVEEVAQEQAPYGPVKVSGSDRTVTLMQNRVVYPYQVPPGSTHRFLLDRLVNGAQDASGGYGMYLRNPVVPIVWDAAGYDPDAAKVNSNLTVDDSTYEFLAKLVDAQGALLRFLPTGELAVVDRDPALVQPAAYTISDGRTGTLLRASRSTSRDGVYNMVRATGSDPAVLTGYRLAYITDPTNPLRTFGPFGPAIRYYASPLLRTYDEADQAAETILARSTGLPTELSLFAVPNPALQPLDVIAVAAGRGSGSITSTHVADEVSIPLVGDAPVEVKTRTVNLVGQTETDPPPTDPPPPPPPGDGGGTPGPTPGGGDPADGTQVALTRGWGAVVDGDEFAYTGRPNGSWGLYDGPGHAGNGVRSPAAFDVHDGMLTITGDRGGTSGGAAFHHGDMGYRVEVRMRTYATGTGGDQYHPVLILWPDSDDWPAGAEYDFAETDVNSGRMQCYMHLPNHEPYRQDFVERDPLDIENWHNYACEWNPDARTLKAWIDGTEFYSGSGRVADAPGPMHLTVQLDNFNGTNQCPAKMDVAWVRIYANPTQAAPTNPPTTTVPTFDHIVVAIMENRNFEEIIGSGNAPYIEGLADAGARFDDSHGLLHPSQGNYLALFSGATQGWTGDTCGNPGLTVSSIMSQLGNGSAVQTFCEDLPADKTTCNTGSYVQWHNPQHFFSGGDANVHNFSSFPSDFTTLPKLSFVIPNQNHNMHDGSVSAGDSWVNSNLGAYATWAKTHNSLLIVTWDEDNQRSVNHIVTVFYGAHVLTGHYTGRIDHYDVLRTIEAAFGLPGIANSAARSPITGCWS